MKLFNKIGLLAIGAIMSIGAAIGVVGNEVIEAHAASESSITLNGSVSGITGTDGNQTVTSNGVTFKGFFKQYSTTALWFTSGKGYIYNTTDLGNIVSISISYKSGGSAAAKQFLTLGDSAITSYKSGTPQLTTSTGGQTGTFTHSDLNTGKGFFNISVSNKNLQATSIVIKYVPLSEDDKVKVDGVTLDQTTLTLEQGQTTTLKETISPADAFNKNVIWSSSDEDVVTVTNGFVTAVGVGNANVTVKSEEDASFNATCAVTVTEATNRYELVENAADLKVGDTVVVAAKDYNYAISTTQNTNNRAHVATVKEGNNLFANESVQILTLTEGLVSGTFGLYTGSGYLYAAHSESNYLKTQETNDANGSWKITISDGVTSVVAQGTNTRNVLQYNNTSGLFACYASASQKAIAIYKLAVELSEEATTYINSFLTKTGAVCATTVNNAAGAAPEAMVTVWEELSAAYALLTESVKDEVKTNADVVARYNTILVKYTGLSNFMELTVSSASSNMLSIINNNGSTNIILVVVIASILIMGTVCLVIRRRKSDVK